MATRGPDFLQALYKFLEPTPQYVLGCLPALAIIGESPMNKSLEKLTWVFRCLGCPFIGLFYTLNIGGSKESRCMYWLPSDYFVGAEKQQLPYRPFGFHSMNLKRDAEQNSDLGASVGRCTATASVLDRCSSFVSGYYIVIGAIEGLSKVTNSIISCDDWPYIPLLLSWTIPAILRRVFSGNLVVKDPKHEFDGMQIVMDHPKRKDKVHKRFSVTMTAIISILYPWTAVLLAYHTPPVGYSCRSKFITIICSIWSFNSALAYFCHCRGENCLIGHGKGRYHIWFSFWGLIIAILLLILSLFTKYSKWWVDVLGKSCAIPDVNCNAYERFYH